MPRATRKDLRPPPPGNVVRLFKQLSQWRRAIFEESRLTGRDKAIAMAHASMVELLSDGQPRIHWASNETLVQRAGFKGHDAARAANVKLIDMGYLLRVKGPGVRSTSYSYLLNVPDGATGPQDRDGS